MPIKQINAITFRAGITAGGLTQRMIQTRLPAAPVMFTTCGPSSDIPKRRDRVGEVVPHGYKKWIPHLDDQVQGQAAGTNTYLFTTDVTCDGKPDCNYWFAEFADIKGELNWDSQVYQCDGSSPAGGFGLSGANVSTGAGGAWNFWQFRWADGGDTGFPGTPAIFAAPARGAAFAAGGAVVVPPGFAITATFALIAGTAEQVMDSRQITPADAGNTVNFALSAVADSSTGGGGTVQFVQDAASAGSLGFSAGSGFFTAAPY